MSKWRRDVAYREERRSVEGPRVYNMRHYNKDAPLDGEIVYVGRPTAYGNPFVIGPDGTRDEVIAKFEQWLRAQPEMIAMVKRNLRGRSLACWCHPAPCHADVLLRIANED